jgi:hypothetical protein
MHWNFSSKCWFLAHSFGSVWGGAMYLVCELLGHHRSKTDAVPLGGGRWRSICRHCRAPMVRVGPKDWKCVDRNSNELKEDAAHALLVPPGSPEAATAAVPDEGLPA